MVRGILYKKRKRSFLPTLARWQKVHASLEPHENSLFLFDSASDMERKWFSDRVPLDDVTGVVQRPVEDKDGCRFDLSFQVEEEE